MILAIETATEVCSVALVHDNNVMASRSVNEKNIHSEKLLVLIDEVLKQTESTPKMLDAIAVSIGPGSFTGLRIGLSAAKGLAFALNIPLITVPTLDGIAEEFRRTRSSSTDENFCAMVEAKRNEAFFAFYSVSKNDIARLTEYSITVKEEILAESKIRNAGTSQPLCNAVAIGLFAERNQNTLTIQDFSQFEPLYLREFVTTAAKKTQV